nr:hypothetical protein asmbl_23 [uncultured bacterium]
MRATVDRALPRVSGLHTDGDDADPETLPLMLVPTSDSQVAGLRPAPVHGDIGTRTGDSGPARLVSMASRGREHANRATGELTVIADGR